MNLMAWPEPDLNPPEPEEAPHISRAQALRDVLAVLYSDDADAAYGWNRAQWHDWLWDEIASQHDVPIVIGLLEGRESMGTLMRVSDKVQLAVELKVNELVAEMDPDELELLTCNA